VTGVQTCALPISTWRLGKDQKASRKGLNHILDPAAKFAGS